MAKSPNPLPRRAYGNASADSRPRIYITAASSERTYWTLGPHGGRNFAGTAGQALDDALRVTRARKAVIFWDGESFE